VLRLTEGLHRKLRSCRTRPRGHRVTTRTTRERRGRGPLSIAGKLHDLLRRLKLARRVGHQLLEETGRRVVDKRFRPDIGR